MTDLETNDDPGADAVLTLRELTAETFWPICQLKLKPGQENFVADNVASIAQAHFSDKAWFRGIYANDTPVGFVMLRDDPVTPRYYLWRYMIAGDQQGKGFGKRALELLIEHVKTRPNATELFLSFVPGAGSPRDFYAKFGFAETGEEHGGELEMRLSLVSDPEASPPTPSSQSGGWRQGQRRRRR